MKFFDEAIPFLFKRGAGGAQGGMGGHSGFSSCESPHLPFHQGSQMKVIHAIGASMSAILAPRILAQPLELLILRPPQCSLLIHSRPCFSSQYEMLAFVY